MVIQVRHSANTGNTPIALANGELALNAMDQLLYYRRVNGSVGILANGASILIYTMAKVSSNTNQIPSNTSPYLVTYNSNDILIGTSHTLGNSRITVASDGWYIISASGQVFRTSGGGNLHYADFWFRKNGIDIPKSATRTSSPTVTTFSSVDNTITLRLNANDYIELVQAVDLASVGLGLTVPTTLAGGPSIPSITITIRKLAN